MTTTTQTQAPELLADDEGTFHAVGCAMAVGTLAHVFTIPQDAPSCPWCD